MATVDHGLRPAAGDEAAMVARFCNERGIAHSVLALPQPLGTSNVMAAARDARYAALSHWAQAARLECVVLGHTQDDVAETFLMRLSRGSGLYGLAAMPAEFYHAQGTRFIRPLLDVSRETLRSYLRANTVDWAEDPTNLDDTYLRSQMRKLLPNLAQVGMDVAKLAGAANQLADAKTVVQAQVHAFLNTHARLEYGDVIIPQSALSQAMPQVAFRAISEILMWIGQSPYPPRAAKTKKIIQAPAGMTLNGVVVDMVKTDIRFGREYRMVADLVVNSAHPWDGRWMARNPQKNKTIQPIGERGWAMLGGRKMPDTPPHKFAIAHPAIWDGGEIIHAPSLRHGDPDAIFLSKRLLSQY